MAKYISELSNSKNRPEAGDYLIADNPSDGKTYKIEGSAFRAMPITFTDLSTITVDHNFKQFPIVAIADEDGNVIEGEITHPSLNRTIISFNSQLSGTVTLW